MELTQFIFLSIKFKFNKSLVYKKGLTLTFLVLKNCCVITRPLGKRQGIFNLNKLDIVAISLK